MLRVWRKKVLMLCLSACMLLMSLGVASSSFADTAVQPDAAGLENPGFESQLVNGVIPG
jgi:hypothetical protein